MLFLIYDWGKFAEGLFNFVVAALPVATFLIKQYRSKLERQAIKDEEVQTLQQRIEELQKKYNESQLELLRFNNLSDTEQKPPLPQRNPQ